MVKVTVKWNKEKYDVDIDTTQPPSVFKSQLFSLTFVPVDRQKIMGFKGGVLKDQADWNEVGLTEGKQLMLVGSAEELAKPTTAVKFLEDLPEDKQIASTLPAGLTNLGNTCYMNATLQCLKAVPELSKIIRTYKPSSMSSGDTALMKTSQHLFTELEHSNNPVTPLVFLSAFRQIYPQFQEKSQSGIYAQQDAEEAWSSLLSSYARELLRVEENGKSTGSPTEQLKRSAIGKLFGIEMQEKFICKDNPSEEPTIRSETVLKMNCNITIETSFLFEGLKKGLEEEISKRSESLGREAIYTKKSQVSVLPPYLTVQFVRFYWKEKEKSKAKIIRIVQFPFLLDLFEFCTPELKEKLAPNRKLLEDEENKKLERRKHMSLKDLDEEDKKQKAQTANQDIFVGDIKPNETGKYELIAVLTHAGRYAEAGHYVAWVKRAEDKWLKYDDQVVSECNNEDIKKLVGGGEWHVAYMCVYKSIPVPVQSDKITEETTSTTTTTTTN
ncbi:ubiquitin domain-containing protein [Tieghemostelium lacteum]|uniref:Ubiquitin carboxyl-terminal hydrolase n=1 Tax=Tieghemostelium lacteum TaxID=361077 RepID=A0A151Z6N4_TIELA|nr:ubiquitin domain-containing protein [Tieghemostelium lacteum]|eukprot:KYQ89626.1 ubiquitin domain-containing protein [Tieghemostelium lacteum]